MSKKFSQQFACSKMMLPEHCSSLKKCKARAHWEETHRPPHPDEQRQDELQQLLDRAIYRQQSLSFTILNAGGYQLITGIPLRTDTAAGFIYLDTGLYRLQKIRAAEIVGIEKL